MEFIQQDFFKKQICNSLFYSVNYKSYRNTNIFTDYKDDNKYDERGHELYFTIQYSTAQYSTHYSETESSIIS